MADPPGAPPRVLPAQLADQRLDLGGRRRVGLDLRPPRRSTRPGMPSASNRCATRAATAATSRTAPPPRRPATRPAPPAPPGTGTPPATPGPPPPVSLPSRKQRQADTTTPHTRAVSDVLRTLRTDPNPSTESRGQPVNYVRRPNIAIRACALYPSGPSLSCPPSSNNPVPHTTTRPQNCSPEKEIRPLDKHKSIVLCALPGLSVQAQSLKVATSAELWFRHVNVGTSSVPPRLWSPRAARVFSRTCGPGSSWSTGPSTAGPDPRRGRPPWRHDPHRHRHHPRA